MKIPVEVDNVTIKGTKDGLKICGSVTLPNGQTFPVCIPERYTQWEDIRREMKNALEAVEGAWKRFWSWVTKKT